MTDESAPTPITPWGWLGRGLPILWGVVFLASWFEPGDPNCPLFFADTFLGPAELAPPGQLLLEQRSGLEWHAPAQGAVVVRSFAAALFPGL